MQPKTIRCSIYHGGRELEGRYAECTRNPQTLLILVVAVYRDSTQSEKTVQERALDGLCPAKVKLEGAVDC